MVNIAGVFSFLVFLDRLDLFATKNGLILFSIGSILGQLTIRLTFLSFGLSYGFGKYNFSGCF
ncbi:Hypothetical protein LUCI_4301 [Lucifera butyrica]|uniref:Uncharacterized protein n=1 Tax=Lucifera butyrica TaxID=1351585 RepID=A0A498RDH9_9FIRM|nr:Hypothetical protein LUCI_4301 [Lucifera butyrica]